MSIVQFEKDDVLFLKKAHPCGANSFKVVALGSDVKITCVSCHRPLIFPREKLEKMIKKVVKHDGN